MFEDLAKAFGEELSHQRKLKKWSQMQLAAASNLHLNAISNLERGKRKPNLLTVFILAQALEINPADFVSWIDLKRWKEPKSKPSTLRNKKRTVKVT